MECLGYLDGTHMVTDASWVEVWPAAGINGGGIDGLPFRQPAAAPGHARPAKTCVLSEADTDNFPVIQAFVDFIQQEVGGSIHTITANRCSGRSRDTAAYDNGGKGPVVLWTTGGGRKTFRITDKASKNVMLELPLVPGMAIAMCGQFQDELAYDIPNTSRRDARYSLTARVN